MSKHNHNYSQYSDKKNQNHMNHVAKATIDESDLKPIVKVAEVTEAKVETAPVVELVNENVETKPIPKTVDGMVVGCAKLNVRAEANLFAEVVCTLNAQSEIEIDVEKSNRDWFYICTATGIEGYCMRKYVEAHL